MKTFTAWNYHVSRSLTIRQQAKGSKSTSVVPLMLQPAAVALPALTPLSLAPPICHAPAGTKALLLSSVLIKKACAICQDSV